MVVAANDRGTCDLYKFSTDTLHPIKVVVCVAAVRPAGPPFAEGVCVCVWHGGGEGGKRRMPGHAGKACDDRGFHVR